LLPLIQVTLLTPAYISEGNYIHEVTSDSRGLLNVDGPW